MRIDLPKPFMKWAGGKGQLLSTIDDYLPAQFNNYFEPFIGGGALFFYLYRQGFKGKAHLSDINEDLVSTYLTIRDSVEDLIVELQSGTYKTDKETFYEIRAWDRNDDWNEIDPIKRIARMIYLNRTCYNGLYRVNKKGQFNVPFGRYDNPTICNEENLRAVSKALTKAKIQCIDFAGAVKEAQERDLIYFDPPYQPVSDTAYFTDYTASGFGIDEQKMLANVFEKLHKRGCYVLESNSSVKVIYDLYSSPEFHIDIVKAKRAISSDPEGRGEVSEVVIRNYIDTRQQRLG